MCMCEKLKWMKSFKFDKWNIILVFDSSSVNLLKNYIYLFIEYDGPVKIEYVFKILLFIFN